MCTLTRNRLQIQWEHRSVVSLPCAAASSLGRPRAPSRTLGLHTSFHIGNKNRFHTHTHTCNTHVITGDATHQKNQSASYAPIVRPQIEFLCTPFQPVEEKSMTRIHGGTLEKTSFRGHRERAIIENDQGKHLPKRPLCQNRETPYDTSVGGSTNR